MSSHDGNITVSFRSCPTLMLSDPKSYEDCLRGAFHELAACAGAREEAV